MQKNLKIKTSNTNSQTFDTHSPLEWNNINFNVSNIVEIKLGSPKKQELHRISPRDLLRDTIVIDNEERKSKRSLDLNPRPLDHEA